jgi:hypothetical protein
VFVVFANYLVIPVDKTRWVTEKLHSGSNSILRKPYQKFTEWPDNVITFVFHLRVTKCRVHTRRPSFLARLEVSLDPKVFEVRVGWSAIVASFRGYREKVTLIHVMSFSETRISHTGKNDKEGEGTCETTPCRQLDRCNLQTTPCRQLDRCNLQTFVYLRSLLLGVVTFCTQLLELEIYFPRWPTYKRTTTFFCFTIHLCFKSNYFIFLFIFFFFIYLHIHLFISSFTYILIYLSIFPVLWQLSPSSGTQTQFLSV